MAVTVTYLVSLNNKTKDHAKGTSISATIQRSSPASLDTGGMSVISATINMGGTTFWSGSNNNPYIDIGSYGRFAASTSISDKSAIPLTEPSSAYNLNSLLNMGTSEVSTSFYATKSTSGNVCTYTGNYATFTITAICQEGYGKSTASVTSSVAAGAVSTVTISNSKLSSLSHKVTWTLGTATKSSTLSAGVGSATYTIPTTWLSQIPDATSARASITVETFNPSGTSLGSNAYAFTVTVPDNIVPSISLAKERVDGTVPTAWGIYVQGKSGIKITATASAGTGSSISSYTISDGATGTQTSNVFSISPVSGIGTVTYTVKVTDKRGRTATASTSITVYEYSAPTISVSTAFRSDASGNANENGTYASVKLSGSVTSVAGKNTKALSVAFAESGSSAFSTATTLTDNVTKIIGAGSLNTTKSYQVRFRVTDAFGYTEKIVNVSTAAYTVFFKEGGNAVAFGKISEHDNALEINGDWAVYHGTARLDGTVAVSRGGTGATTVAGARNALGLGNTSGAVPIANGGTGATTAAGARNALGLGNTSGALPIANGGTGATTAAGAVTNLGITAAGIGAAASSHKHAAGDINSGTIAAARLPFKVAYGSTSCSGSSAASIDYSSAGFTAVPKVVVSYATTSTNWSGDNGALKIYSKTKTGCTIIVGGSFNTSRNIDWIAIGT